MALLKQCDSFACPAVDSATAEILGVVPFWAPLYEIPKEYFALDGDETSATCALVPQSIFLGETFATRNNLLESIIHENAHLWLDLLLEVGNFQTEADESRYELPSGTPNKTLTGVLMAAHFGATAHRFYIQRRVESIDRTRGDFLLQYTRECLQRIANAEGLTTTGRHVWQCLLNTIQGGAYGT